MQSPQRVCHDLMPYLLPLAEATHSSNLRTGRSQYRKTLARTDRTDTKQVCGITDYHNALVAVCPRDRNNTHCLFFRVTAVRFGDDSFLRNAVSHQVCLAYLSFGVGIAGFTASQRDNGWRNPVFIQRQGMIEPCAQNGRGSSTVLSRTKDADHIRWGGLILIGIALNMYVYPDTPGRGECQTNREKEEDHKTNCRSQPAVPRTMETVFGHGIVLCSHQRCSASAISCVEIAPSRRICQWPLFAERSTMVVGSARPEGPPSTINGIRSPI